VPAASTARKAARPATRWPISLGVLLGLGAALGGLNRALTDTNWWFAAMGVATLVTVTIIGLRAVVRFRWLPPVGGLVVLIVATTFSFAPGLGYLGIIPSPDSVAAFGRLITAGRQSIAEQAIPADATTGIVFLLTAATGLVAIGLDYLAQLARRPALVGIPLLVILLVPTFFGGGAGNPLSFVLTAGAYLLVLYLDLGEVRAGGALGVGATAVAAALIAPLLLPPITAPDPAGNGSGFVVGINSFISLGENLRRPRELEVLTYTNENQEPQYLTVSIIKNFSGTKWNPAAPSVNEGNTLDSFTPAPGLGTGVETIERTTSISIVNMGGHWAPVPYAPTGITELEGNWSFDSETLSVVSPNLSIRGEQYVVTSAQVNPTEEQLRAAVAVSDESLAQYLMVPDDLPEIVAQTAAEVAGDAPTRFDQAMALQNYFTSGDFTYSELAPVQDDYDGTGALVVGRFLEEKSGYCVHFSSAMAIMARALGIPARIAIGFTPGEYHRASGDSPAYYSVSTSNLHAWPELWFDGIGWVRFEPTPGRGITPSFETENASGPSTAPTAGPSTAPTSVPLPTRTPTPTATDAADGPDLATSPDQTVPRVVVTVLVVAALIVMLLPLVPIAVRGWRRARRSWRVRRHGSAVDAWAELRDTATDLGWSSATLTPREFAIAARQRQPEKVVRALANLLTALEATAYSPTPAESMLRDLRVARRAMLRSSSRRERLRAAVTPASVQIRVGQIRVGQIRVGQARLGQARPAWLRRRR
jgi:transglutaminase-like putative cysteine protease